MPCGLTCWLPAPIITDSREDGGTYDGILPFTGYLSGGNDLAHYDLTKPNEAYFARVDQMLTLAANHGMVVFLDPIETGQWVPTLRNQRPRCRSHLWPSIWATATSVSTTSSG